MASSLSGSPPTIDDLRRGAAFHNTVDVWIGACAERGVPWEDGARYGRFVEHLRGEGVALRPFQLCVSDGESADPHERSKAEFARAMKGEGNDRGAQGAGTGAAPPGVHSVRLNDRAAEAARGFLGGGAAAAAGP